MGILFSEPFLLFEVSLFWAEVEDWGLLLIVLSVEASSDVSFSSLAEGAVEVFSVPRVEEAFKEGVLFSSGILPFDSAVSNELLVPMGTDALDWLLEGGTKVAFDWLVGAPKGLTLL